MGRSFPCALGQGGVVADKVEGDGGTPRGLMRITGCLYRSDRVRPPNEWARPIRLDDLWSDDPTDPDYNHLVRSPHRFGHETLRHADPLYDIVLLTDWNWPDAVPGKGSAIFVHQWRRARFPTQGCVAFRPDHLAWIAARVVPGTPVIVR